MRKRHQIQIPNDAMQDYYISLHLDELREEIRDLKAQLGKYQEIKVIKVKK